MGAIFKPVSRVRKARQPTNAFLRDVVKSFRGMLVTTFIFSFFINLLSLVLPLYLLQIYSKVLPSRNLDTLAVLTIIVLVGVVTLGVLEAVRRSILQKTGVRFDHLLSAHLLSSSIHRSVQKSYASVSVMRDLSRLRNFLTNASIIPLLDLPWAPLFLICLAFLHPLLGAVGLIGCLIMLGLAVFNERATREKINDASNESRQLMDSAQSWIRNADTVQAMGMQKTLLSQWNENNAQSLMANYQSSQLNSRLASASKMVRLFLQIAIICTAAWLIISKQLTPGITIASVLLMRRAIDPLEQSIRSWKSVIKARQSFDNISEYLDHYATLQSDVSMPRPIGQLVAQKMSFRRSGESKSQFSGVTLSVEPGVITALVGPTAAGKSTLLRVMCGIVPPRSGRVTLDGYDLAQWSPELLGPHIGYLSQDVGLFPGSVRDNICRFNDASIESVIDAAKLANAHEMIQLLPNGYDTEIQEGGSNLSGGQRQRVGFARAVFGNPCVVILDEPDANLDAPGRSKLRNSLRQLRRQNVAILVTTHRSSLEKICGRVYQLKNGSVSMIHEKQEAPDTSVGTHVIVESQAEATNSASLAQTQPVSLAKVHQIPSTRVENEPLRRLQSKIARKRDPKRGYVG
ncbi:type I secretion system permease/ATPase [Granulosicoccus antarcticus]|uniref:Type I secretion system ATP-binding protein PrsD n=1 Tax=Granulosicoccus antarcticus IMCC3135 TaxID=1192854 RepID=A0A2Z2NZA1_9GAMM|nr:type I secretion system permease/ATPase [Granulosicoccus antarcticus]ASJ73127.1 Type I secretion system ATP-binding protein PrsD [Granulosicoccus antarcticus IMCC3135]